MVIGGNDDPFGNSPYFSTVELVSLDPASNPVPECLTNIADIPNVKGISFASVGMSSGVSHNGNLKKRIFSSAYSAHIHRWQASFMWWSDIFDRVFAIMLCIHSIK